MSYGVAYGAFSSERAFVEKFCDQMFRLFPKMTVGALEVPGIDGVADIVLAQPRSVEMYLSLRCGYLDPSSVECTLHAKDENALAGGANLFRDIVAIEAKIKDWRAGLYQASRYRQFAHRVYVMLTGAALDNALKNEATFRRNGIGIIGYRDCFKVYVSSERASPRVDLSRSFFMQKTKGPRFLRMDAIEPLAPLADMRECTALSEHRFGAAFGTL